MAQIAEEAGLSRFTVSKILNGDSSVREKNRTKVLELCRKHGFVPNANAVNLVSGTSRVIGMVVPYITDGFYAELIELIEKRSSRRGYHMIYQSSYNDAATEANIIRAFIGLNVAALLVVPVVVNPDIHIHKAAAANFPVIYLDRALPGDTSCSILNDNRDSCRQMTAHLLEHSPEVAFLDSFYGESNRTAVDRKMGYLDAMREAGAQELILPGGETGQTQDNEYHGYNCISAFLQQHSRPPRALCCVTDAVALGAMRALRDNGFVPGRDTLIGGHDNLHFGEFTTPTLSSMAQPKEEIAELAVNMALKRLDDPTAEPERKLLRSTLIVRDSSSPRGGTANTLFSGRTGK